MFIRQISIKNFRNFGDPPFVIKLKPFTLILGENNIGKTNLLHAISLILSQEITIFRQRILEIDDINFESLSAFKKMVANDSISAEHVIFPEVKIDLIMSDLNDKQMGAAGDWPVPGDTNLNEATVSYLFAPHGSFNQSEWVKIERARLASNTFEERINIIDFPIGEYRYSIYGSEDRSNKCDLHYLNMFRMDLLEAIRDAQKELIATGNSRLLFRILNQRDNTKYDDIKVFLSELNKVIDGNHNLTNIILEVKELLDKVSLENPNSDNSVSFRFTSPETTDILKKLSMVYGLRPVDVARNGLGRNNLLYISLILSHLSAVDNQNNDIVFRLVAIEEPEAHLHPHLQDHIAENIEGVQKGLSETMQLLLTSHSTHIAAKLNFDNTTIIYLDNKTKSVRNHYILSNLDVEKEKSSISYLSKYLDATKSRMFFAQKLILVEGIAEQLLIPLFFKLYFGYSLEKVGSNIINVNGVAFKHFLKIIQSGYFIKCLVLTDSDIGTKTAQRAEDLKKEYEKLPLIKVMISKQATFEKDLILSNNSGKGKAILERALKATRPNVGKNFVIDYKDKDLDVDSFFTLIEDFKSEFAFNVEKELHVNNDGFCIPDYITQGFNFMR